MFRKNDLIIFLLLNYLMFYQIIFFIYCINNIIGRPKEQRKRPRFFPVERELVFDIDMTDYDEVRTCCEGTDICNKCWKFMILACKILDTALRGNYTYVNVRKYFSFFC